MKPVYQALVDPARGDCYRCCVASILELEREAVPNFRAEADDLRQPMDELAWCWLQARGLAELVLYVHEHEHGTFNWHAAGGAYCIMSVPSQRFAGGWHSVVGQFVLSDYQEPGDNRSVSRKIVHDPNPGNAPYPDETKPRALTFLVPILPKLEQYRLPAVAAMNALGAAAKHDFITPVVKA